MFGTLNAAQVCGRSRPPARMLATSAPDIATVPTLVQPSARSKTDTNGGCCTLAEWHTHAEDYPSASGLDDDAMHRLIASSPAEQQLAANDDRGSSTSAAGLAVWSVASTAARRWILSASQKET